MFERSARLRGVAMPALRVAQVDGELRSPSVQRVRRLREPRLQLRDRGVVVALQQTLLTAHPGNLRIFTRLWKRIEHAGGLLHPALA